MLKLPIRSPTTPEPHPLPPLIQPKPEEAPAAKKKEPKHTLLENYMRRLERKPQSRNLG